jgi:UDP-glucuronate decarboxylase
MKHKVRGNRFLVTGGAGFVGSHMCDAIIKGGGAVICVDDLSTGKKQHIRHLLKNNKFSFIKANVNDIRQIKKIFEKNKIDYIFHYAAMVGVKRTIENPLGVFEDFIGVKNIAELAKRHRVKKIFFSSSSEVYGEPLKLPIQENDTFNARVPYGLVKILSEKYLQDFYHEHNVPVTIARFFNVYGPRQDSGYSGFVMSVFIKNALDNKPVEIFGDGKQTRDFVYIDDNIRLTLKAFFNEGVNSKPINIGSGKSITINDLTEAIGTAIKGLRVKYKTKRSGGEIKYRQPDVSFMKKTLRDKPEISLKEGISKTVDYFKK